MMFNDDSSLNIQNSSDGLFSNSALDVNNQLSDLSNALNIVFPNNNTTTTNSINQEGNMDEIYTPHLINQTQTPSAHRCCGNQSEKRRLGRVPRRGQKDDNGNDIQGGKHNEYSKDNLEKKTKTMLIKNLKDFTNEKIIEKEGRKPDINKNILMQLNPEPIKNSKADYNKEFLYKPIREILSGDIARAIHFKKDHNKKIPQHSKAVPSETNQ